MALRAVPEHPKFAELQSRLNLPKFAALGLLESIWHFTGRFAPQGNIGKYTDQAIESWIGWDGSAGLVIPALVAAGWVDEHETYRLVTHHWQYHADHATRLALKRGKITFCMSGGPTPDLHRTYTDQDCLPSEGLPGAGAGAGAGAKAKTSAEINSAPALDSNQKPLTLPLITGMDWPIPAANCLAWAEAYPAVNVLTEILKMRAWFEANPKNRKTQKGIKRFMVAWLARAQDAAARQGGGDRLVIAARQKREEEARAQARRKEIEEFWKRMPDMMQNSGHTQAEILERFPSFKGTKPR